MLKLRIIVFIVQKVWNLFMIVEKNNQYTLMDRLKVLTRLLLASCLEQVSNWLHCDVLKVVRCPQFENLSARVVRRLLLKCEF